MDNNDFQIWEDINKESRFNRAVMNTFDEYGITKEIYAFVASQSDMFKILVKIHPEVTLCGCIASCLTTLLKKDMIILKKKDVKHGH
jgi:hypothetical protein